MINVQPQTFKSDLNEIARAMLRAGVDPHLGPPKGANVKIEAHLGIITLFWTGGGKTYTVDQFVPAPQWYAAKAGGNATPYLKRCIVGMRKELSQLKRDQQWKAA